MKSATDTLTNFMEQSEGQSNEATGLLQQSQNYHLDTIEKFNTLRKAKERKDFDDKAF